MRDVLKEIQEVIVNNPQIKAMSVDIFDTVLFRTTVIPDRVFWRMHQKKKEIFPSFTSAGDWVNSRKMAEKEARRINKEKHGHEEVILEEIYRHLPTAYLNDKDIMQLELECECELGYINEELCNVLKSIKEKQGITLFAISDMYLSSEQICEVLYRNGLDITLFDGVYVSSERKCSKRNGKLYQLVLKENNLFADELFHIGDNFISDVTEAQKLGILSYHYDFISGRNIQYPFLVWEQDLYAGPLCEVFYLTRLLANKNNKEKTDREKFFFELGAMILGPFFTCATEWVLDEAQEKDIKVIRPLMREGKFITTLLNSAKQNRGQDISIEPLYISRIAAYASSFSKMTAKELETLMAGANMTLQSLLRLLNIEDIKHEYDCYKAIQLVDLQKKNDHGGKSVFDNIFDYLSQTEILELIRERNEDKKELFTEYLLQMGLDEAVITVDVGWNGTTMRSIYQAVSEIVPEPKLLQLLFCSSKNVAQTSTEGCFIKGYIGNYGGGQGKFNNIFIPIFEMFSLCEEGPTVGYRRSGQKIVPVMDENIFPKEWISNIKAVQSGIMSFQAEYYKLISKKNKRINPNQQKVQALSIIERLFAQPLLTEVKYLGTAELDQNIGVDNRRIPVLEETLLKEYVNLGAKQFYMHYRNRQRSITWYQALQTISNPLLYLQLHYLKSAQYSKLASVLIVEQLFSSSEKVVLVYSGVDTDTAVMHIKAMQRENQIAGIVCAEKCLHGTIYNGKEILPMETYFDTNIYFIAEKEYIEYAELKEQLISAKDCELKIYGYYECDKEDFR